MGEKEGRVVEVGEDGYGEGGVHFAIEMVWIGGDCGGRGEVG